jgi:gliding motility-associated lipoprotein GldH
MLFNFSQSKILKMVMMIMTVVSLASCDRNVLFEKNIELPENRWEQKNAIKFTVNVEDTINPHNLYINLRNASGYQFSNIFLFFTTTAPSGKMERDTLELMLADASGKWLGDGAGDIWDNRQLFKRNFRFPEAGTYTFQLEQAMRIDPLPQIMDAGIRIEKSEK